MTEPKIKTLFLYEDTADSSCFFELEGDYSHLNNVYINGTDSTDAQQAELTELLLKDEKPYFKLPKLDAPTRDWAHFVKCGFLA